MQSGNVIQIIMVLAGAGLLAVTVNSLARRKMTEAFCLAWGLIAVVLVLAGFLLNPTDVTRYISETGLVFLLLVAFCIVYIAYFMSIKVSELERRNQELAMQVSLLNQEKRRLQRQVDGLEKDKEKEK